MANKIKCLLVKVGEAPCEIEIVNDDNKFAKMRELISADMLGYYYNLKKDEDIMIIHDDMFAINGKPFNTHVCGQMFCGDFIISGL